MTQPVQYEWSVIDIKGDFCDACGEANGFDEAASQAMPYLIGYARGEARLEIYKVTRELLHRAVS